MTLTTTVTWADLIHAHDDELDELRDAYEEIAETAEDKYGEDWRTQPNPDDTLVSLREQAQQYDQAAETIQQRQHLLDRLREEYGDGDFELAMLTGEETMDIETELRAYAQREDLDLSVVQTRRNALTVDAATVDAPEGVPREDDSPVPSACPNALTLALFQQVQRFNSAGDPDFRAAGLGEASPAPTRPSASSATPSVSSDSSVDSPE